MIRALLRGEEVSHHGLVTVDRARLWTLPAIPPKLLGAAVSAATARTVAGGADGLITVDRPIEELTLVIDAFREAGGENKPVPVQVQLRWARTETEALAIAHDQWRSNVFSGDLAWNLETPEQFDAASEHVRPEEVRRHVCVSADLGVHLAWLQQITELGVDELVPLRNSDWGGCGVRRQAAWWYSWMSPPSTSFRSTRSGGPLPVTSRSAGLAGLGSGDAWSRDWCGRWPL